MAEAAISLLEENARLMGRIEELEKTFKKTTKLPPSKHKSYCETLWHGTHNASSSTPSETIMHHPVHAIKENENHPQKKGLLI